MRDSRRSNTLKIRPWSQLPGVVAYLVLDGQEQVTDAWGEPAGEGLARAASFRERVLKGAFDGSHTLENVGSSTADGCRLLSVSRRDGWFVHVWIEGTTEVAGILSVVGG